MRERERDTWEAGRKDRRSASQVSRASGPDHCGCTWPVATRLFDPAGPRRGQSPASSPLAGTQPPSTSQPGAGPPSFPGPGA